ncbi:periplasmic binding protein-like II [Neocallimastix lanati (nom. inval.)]|nr:periplasmic binding protein-like II [Neocallimastix sp. JGI-2020a]
MKSLKNFNRIMSLYTLFYIKYNNLCNIRASVLYALAFTQLGESEIYTFLINNFNKYSKENGYDITIKLNLLTPSNSTSNTNDFLSLMESILLKKSDKYDIYFYNNIYTSRFEPHFLNLKEWLPKEHIDKFTLIDSDSYSYNNKLIGLPIFIDYSVIYNNMKLLKEYDKKIPKTWDELLETGKYILNEELKKNNTDIIIYNGGFIDDELGMGSIYEFMYSYREEIDSPFPEIISQNTIDSLKMMKKLKEEISSDSIFNIINHSVTKLYDGNGLFIKFSYHTIPINPVYKATVLPGLKEGISGTIIGGYNIGISKYSKAKKRNDSIKALTYITSKETQKRFMIECKKFSGITSLYDDEDVCNNEEFCEIYKNVQPVSRPISAFIDYNEYSEKFRYHIYKYLYGDDSVDAEEVLKEIYDITHIYYISLNSKELSIGIILFLLYIILSLMMLLSSLFLFSKRYQNCFDFLPKDFWILSLIGFIMILFIGYLDMGNVTEKTCQMKQLLFYLCITFILIPIFYKLIIKFPEENKISKYIGQHRHLFLLFFILLDLGSNALSLIFPYSIENVIVPENKNFQKCKVNNNFLKIMIILTDLFKGLILVSSMILIFIEWYIKSSYYDVRICISAISINMVIIIIYIFINSMHINDYTIYHFTRQIIFLFLTISNFILHYLMRIIKITLNNESTEVAEKNKFFKKALEQESSMNSNTYYARRFSIASEKCSYSSKVFYKILDLHYRDDISSSKNLYEIHENNSILNTTTISSKISSNQNESYQSSIKEDNIK